MSTLNVSMFGQLSVRRDPGTIIDIESRKVQELFCYLLLYRDRPHPRESLASLLWDNVSTVQSRAYLRKALWQLQSTLDSRNESCPGGTLLVETDWVRLNPRADLWYDVAFFERAFALVEGFPGEQLNPAHAESLEQAVALYQGDLLDGWYQDWCLFERERLQNIYLALLDKLMGYCEVRRSIERGLTYGAQVLRYDCAREQTHRRLMRLYFLAGDRTGALRQFERCAAALDDELGISPTDHTTMLYEQIKANRLDDPVPAENRGEPCMQMTMPLAGLLASLKQIQDSLSAVQYQVQQHVQSIEQTLKKLG